MPPNEEAITQIAHKAFTISNKAEEAENHDDYAQGVYEALNWVLGKDDAPVLGEGEPVVTGSEGSQSQAE